MNRVEQSAQQNIPALDQGVLLPMEFNRIATPVLTPVTVLLTVGATICVAQKACATSTDVGYRFDSTEQLPADDLVEARRLAVTG